MDFLNQAGTPVSFVQWILVGTPIAIISILFSWFIIVRVFKPTELPDGVVNEYLKSMNVPKRFDFKETSVAIIVLTMVVLWILSSWFPVFNVTVVGTIGFALLFLPGIKVLEWKEYTRKVSWASFFLMGTMLSLGNALSANGVSDWLIQTMFPKEMDMPLFVVVLFISLIVFLLLLPIPIGPALISMLGVPFITLAETWGMHPALLLLPLVICAASCFLLPLDTVPLLTYVTGYYKMSDMPKVSIAIQLVLAVLVAGWVPLALHILGII
jgi:sodium-dependent dicarboxylate transporter 2/3/5